MSNPGDIATKTADWNEAIRESQGMDSELISDNGIKKTRESS